jgi:MFS family permease
VKWAIFGTVLFAAFVYSLNAKGTILESRIIIQAVALDHYKSQWITGPEGVAGLVTLFASIYFIKVHGVRRMFLLGAICLLAGSLGAALAQNAWHITVAGIVRSCSGFYMIPSLAMAQQLFPQRRRLVYCLFLALVYGGQVVVEPIGAILAYHPSWRAVFFGLLVCATWLVLSGLFLFPRDVPARPPVHGFDYAGAVLFITFLSLVFFLLYRGNYLGWGISTPICLAAAALVVVTVVFVWRELVAPEPFISLAVFGYKTVTVTMLTAACWSASLYGVAILLPDFLLLIGFEHWKTGWVLLPMALAMIASMFVGSMMVRRGTNVWLLRAGLAGMTLLALGLARVDLDTGWKWVMGMSLLWGICAGMCLEPIALLVYEGQRPEVAAATGAMKFFMRAFGALVGVLAGGILVDRASAWGLEFVRSSVVYGQGALQVVEPALRDHMVRHGSAPAAAETQAQALLGSWVDLQAQVIGYRTALRYIAYMSAAGLVVALFISRRKETSALDDVPAG